MAANLGWVARICGACVVAAIASACGRGAPPTEQRPEFFNEATPYQIEDVRPASSSPNVIVWVVDDLGFGQVGAFGGQCQGNWA